MSSELIYRDDVGSLHGIDAAPALEFPDAALTRALRGYVHGRLGNHADGDDLVQETFLRLLGHQNVSRVNDVKAMCFAIARNLLHDHYRASRRTEHVELDEAMVCPMPLADQVLAYRRAVDVMVGALERMPPLRREIFLRKRLDGLSTAEIAASTEMSLAAVEKHVVRALADLRAALARRGFTMADGA